MTNKYPPSTFISNTVYISKDSFVNFLERLSRWKRKGQIKSALFFIIGILRYLFFFDLSEISPELRRRLSSSFRQIRSTDILRARPP